MPRRPGLTLGLLLVAAALLAGLAQAADASYSLVFDPDPAPLLLQRQTQAFKVSKCRSADQRVATADSADDGSDARVDGLCQSGTAVDEQFNLGTSLGFFTGNSRTVTVVPDEDGVATFEIYSAEAGTTLVTSDSATGSLSVTWDPVYLDLSVTVEPVKATVDGILTATVHAMNTTDPPTPLAGITVTFKLASGNGAEERSVNALADTAGPVFTDGEGVAVLPFTAPVGDWVLIATGVTFDGTSQAATSNPFTVTPAPLPDRVILTPAKATVPCGRPTVLTARVLSNTSEPVRRTPVTFGLSGSCMNAVLIDGRVTKAGSKTVVTDDKGVATIWLFNEGEPGSVAVVAVVSNGVRAIMSQPAHVTFFDEAEEEEYEKEERPPHPYYQDEPQHAPHQPEENHGQQHPAAEQAPVQAPEEHDRQQVQQREAVREAPLPQREPLREAPLQQREALREAPLQQREAVREAPLPQREAPREAPLPQREAPREAPLPQREDTEAPQRQDREAPPLQQREAVREAPLPQREALREAPAPLDQQAPRQQRQQPQQRPQRNAAQEQQAPQPRQRTPVAQGQQPVARPNRARAGEQAHAMAAQPFAREPEVAYEEEPMYVEPPVYSKKTKHDRRKHSKKRKQYKPTKQYDAQAYAAEAARVAIAAMPA